VQLLGGSTTEYLSDIADILIVSYIIYQLLTLMRGTRAIQLVQGITILIFIWFISGLLHLTTLRWLIENLFSVGLIAVIVIFQPELRRALEQLGRGGFIRKSRQVEDQLVAKVVEELTKAVSHLSQARIGALIVIERQTGLFDYMQTGTLLEAKLSAELLKNLFFPNAPLHDGAVMIRNDHLMAAGCYLPLSENPSISKELGTRHRAGIGMSEISDAVIVIVSEETGQISLAIRGKLDRGLSKQELAARLHQELKPSEKKNISLFFHRRKRGEKTHHE
jgi:diadenylate cyclase